MHRDNTSESNSNNGTAAPGLSATGSGQCDSHVHAGPLEALVREKSAIIKQQLVSAQKTIKAYGTTAECAVLNLGTAHKFLPRQECESIEAICVNLACVMANAETICTSLSCTSAAMDEYFQALIDNARIIDLNCHNCPQTMALRNKLIEKYAHLGAAKLGE